MPALRILAAALGLGFATTAWPVAAAPLPAAAPPERLGPVWPIVERDIRETIMERLQARLPEIRKRLEESLAQYRVPATSRPTTTVARTLVWDPSLTLTADLVSHDGRTLAKEGTRVNPLTLLPLRRTYVVLDAADERQVKWAARELVALPSTPATVLLTDGSMEEARKALPDRVRLFPAPAALFARLPIDSVPARLRRDGDRIRIDFIPEGDLPQ
jgi:conjugal transfer pilus assembly protein TraW